MNAQTIPALANAIADTFPELGGRSIAVSEVQPFGDKTNIPTLPIAVTALVKETGKQVQHGGGQIELTDDILVQFIFEPVKYTLSGGSDSPFFAYYDYESIRDRMLSMTQNWRSPRNAGLSFKQMDVESDEFAVYIAMRFSLSEQWCPQDEGPQPSKMKIVGRVLVPKSEKCD